MQNTSLPVIKTSLASLGFALTVLTACRQPDMTVSTNVEVPVGVIEVSASDIEEYVSTTGTVYPMKEVMLTSEILGDYHLQVNPATGKPYALGDPVRVGATIVRLEDEEYMNNLRIRSKEVDMEISRLEFEKQQSLYEKGGATLRELKNAEINLINTEYEMKDGQINLEKMSVTAPFDGVIAELPYFTGGTRVPANTELVKIIDYGKLFMEANLPEKYFGNLDRGFKVYITSYTRTEDTLSGAITQIAPSIDPEARTFTCFVEVDNRERTLLPGMFVKADMVINSAEKVIVIPRDIIISRNRNQIVYVVENGLAGERILTTGLENRDMVEVRMGLLEGESIVISGFETLRDQSRVKILR